MKVLVIGGGYASCSVARMLMDAGHEAIIFEKEKVLGGMARSFYLDGMTYEFGPHILANHACEQKVIDFILKYIRVKKTSMETATFMQNQFLNYPPYIGDVERLKQKEEIQKEIAKLSSKQFDETNFETYLISKVGKTLYELYFKHFTEKFWMVDPKTLNADWAKLRHLGESLTEKQMFFNKTWCSYPVRDFNELFENISKGMTLRLNCSIAHIDPLTATVVDSKGVQYQGDMIVSSVSLDRMFENKFGELEYRGYEITPKIIEEEYYHPVSQNNPSKHISMVYYPEEGVPQTRTTEYKCFNHKQNDPAYKGRSIITVEVPSKKAKFYPFMDEKNEKTFAKYIKHLSTFPKLVSLGRLGLYKYTTLDTTTQQTMRFME